MYHLKNAKESNGVVGVFKKNNSENTSENTYTVNKVFFLSSKTQPGFDARHRFESTKTQPIPRFPDAKGASDGSLKTQRLNIIFLVNMEIFSMLLFRGVS